VKQTLTVMILTAAAVVSNAAEPPTEAQCQAFIREYYAAKDQPKSKPPTAAQIRQWHVCTDTYSSVMELSNRIIKQRHSSHDTSAK
jgi:hypothetical protein